MKLFLKTLLLIAIFQLILYSLISADIKFYKPDYDIKRVEHLIYKNGKLFCEGYNFAPNNDSNYYVYNVYDGKSFVSISQKENNFPQKLNKHPVFVQKPFVINENNDIYALYNNVIIKFSKNNWIEFYKDTIKGDTLLDLTAIHKDIFNNIWLLQLKKVPFSIDRSGNPIHKAVGGKLLKISNESVQTIIDTVYNDNDLPDYLFAGSGLMSSDSKGNLIIANSYAFGIYNPNNKTLNRYPLLAENHGASDFKQTNGLFVDKDDKIWMIYKNSNSSKGGLSNFKDDKWTFITKNEGYDYFKYMSLLGSPDFVFISKDSSIWIGSFYGAIKIKNKKVEIIDPKIYHNKPDENSVTSIAEGDSGEIYLGVTDGVLIYKDDGISSVEDSKTDFALNNIFSSSEIKNIKFDIELSKVTDFKVFNMLVNEMKVGVSQNNNSIIIQADLNAGLYGYTFEMNNKMYSGKILIYEKQ
jgi:hypothetical protein